MAKKQEENKYISIEHAEKIAKNLKKAADQGRTFADAMSETSFHTNNIIDEVNEIAKEIEVGGENFRQFTAASRSLSKGLSENVDILGKIKEGEMDIHEVQKARDKQQQKSSRLYNAAKNLETELTNQKMQGLSDAEAKLMEDQIKSLKTRAAEGDMLMGEAMSTAEKGNTNMAKGLRGISGVMDKIGQKGLGKTFNNMAGAVSKAKLAGGGFAKQMMAAGKAAKLNPYMLIASAIIGMVKMFIQANNETAKLGRELGVSAAQASSIKMHFIKIAEDVARLGVEYQDVMKQNSLLNKSLGTASVLHKDITGEAAVLAKRMNMSAEATVGMMQAALATGKASEQVSTEAIRGAEAAAREAGVRIQHRDAMEDILKTTGQLRGAYGANMELLGKSVTKAKLLGMTLGEVASQSRKMLDFQSSIEAEMEAELFLGRQLNLETARLAAMTNDHATYMDEVLKNAGDFFEFSEMNVFQQEKLAASLGMSSDALSDMLFKRENLNSLQEAANKATTDELKARYQQLSIQEAFNATMQKMKVLVINLFNKLESAVANSRILKFLGLEESDFQLKGLGEGDDEKTSADRDVVGKANMTIPANDFKIVTHPKDTLVMAGGTRLGNNNNSMTSNQAEELIRVSKTNRVFSYNGFAAVKEDGHYGTKFS